MPTTRTCRAMSGVLGTLALCLLTARAIPAPPYETRRLGLHPNGWDPEQADEILRVKDRWIAGTSRVGYGPATPWIYDVLTDSYTIVGLYDDPYVGTGISDVTKTGYALGYTLVPNPYFPGNIAGDAWAYDPRDGSITIIGLRGPDFPLPQPNVRALNDVGQVVGISMDADEIRHVWFYDSATHSTVEIPLPPLDRSPSIVELTEDGLVLGDNEPGWLYHHSTGVTHTIPGLVGPQFDAPPGQRGGGARDVNASGLAVGASIIHNGGTPSHGSRAWIFDPAIGECRQIVTGMDPGDDEIYESAVAINDEGIVVGASLITSSPVVSHVWRYDSATETLTFVTLPSSFGRLPAPDTIDESGMIAGRARVM